MFSSEKLVQQCFLIGMFDGRGYFDINSENAKVRYVAIDCANSNLGNFLCEVISNYGMEFVVIPPLILRSVISKN